MKIIVGGQLNVEQIEKCLGSRVSINANKQPEILITLSSGQEGKNTTM